jgi:O-antigen ligase
MIDHPLNSRYSQVVNVLIFIFPIVINSLQVAGDIVLFILAMMGIYVGISQKLSPFHIKEIKVFSYLSICYFTAVCLSVLLSGQMAELAHYIPRDFYFLFAPFIALSLYRAKININYLIAGAKVSLLVIGSIVIYYGGERNTGVINAGVFGNLAVLLFFIVLAFSQYETFKRKIFTFIPLFLGFIAIIGSGTRGAWLSFLLLFGVYLYFNFKQKTKLLVRSKIILLFIIVITFCITSLNESLQNRVQIGYTQISNWIEGDPSPSSVGLRLNMYKKAIDNIKDVPFFGYGLRTSNINLFKNDSSSMGVISARFNHLHNAFLTNYYNGGIFLLGALLLILFVPMIIFLKANSQNRTNPVFIAGVLLTVGYASIGMINILLGDTYMNGFYTFFLAIFMLLYAQSVKISST